MSLPSVFEEHRSHYSIGKVHKPFEYLFIEGFLKLLTQFNTGRGIDTVPDDLIKLQFVY